MTNQAMNIEEFNKIITEYQKRFAAELVTERLQRAASNGYWVSRPPFGYSPNGKTKIMKVNRKGRALRVAISNFLGGNSKENFLDEVARLLSPRATRRQVHKIVHNPFYRGKVSYMGKKYDGLHEPLMNEAEYKTIVEKLAM